MPMVSSFYDDPLLGLHDLEITEPQEPAELTTDNPDSEEKSIHEEYLEFADLHDFVAAANKMGKLEELRVIVGQELIKKRNEDKPLVEKEQTPRELADEIGYQMVTIKYRKLFGEIRERARIKIAFSEEPIWEIIYSSKNSEQSGPSKRNYIVKNKDRYLLPGVWCISSHQSVNDYGVFLASQCIVKYLADAPESDPESIVLVSRRTGRPVKQEESK